MRRSIIFGICIIAIIAAAYFLSGEKAAPPVVAEVAKDTATVQLWVGPGHNDLNLASDSARLLNYGRELLANTARYLGPKGSVMQIANGMNCQNCHLEGGTRPWGNNYGAVYSTYPRLRNRSGELEGINRRINDCFERSMNGQVLDTASREIKAIYAYFKWVGRGVPKGVKPPGAGLQKLAYLDRAADTVRGKAIYVQKCQLCHGAEGKGQLNADAKTYLYPPLWGEDSYSTAAGLLRLSAFAGYVYNNMPFGANWQARQLTEEEAWDVAAFVNSQPRPVKTFSGDWPDISRKPIDHPFGPYADGFSEEQHRYGPFGPIAAAREAQAKEKR